MKRQAQASMEFLMTYGWAIIVVLVCISSLAYFGVLNATKFLPETCIIAPGFSCDDFKVGADGTVTVIVRNGARGTISSTSMLIGSTAGTCNPVIVPVGQPTTCTITIPAGSSGDRFSESITLSYTEESGFTHYKTGKLVTRYE